MKSTFTGISSNMLSPSIVGRKVVRKGNEDRDDAQQGDIVAFDNRRDYIWVVWTLGSAPIQHRLNEVLLAREEMNLSKTMKFSGKTLGALAKFVEQVEVEGGDEDTVLNPGKVEYVAIVVELPLATDAGGKKPGTIENPFPNPADFVGKQAVAAAKEEELRNS